MALVSGKVFALSVHKMADSGAVGDTFGSVVEATWDAEGISCSRSAALNVSSLRRCCTSVLKKAEFAEDDIISECSNNEHIRDTTTGTAWI